MLRRFRLTLILTAGATLAACGGSGDAPASQPPGPPANPAPEEQSTVTVSGVLTYEWVPTRHNDHSCFGLDFAAAAPRPIRAATVQLLDSGNRILDTSVTADDGSYSFENIAANTEVKVRARAELKRVGVPGWDVQVRDNVDNSSSPPPLQNRPLYLVEWASFNTGGGDIDDADFLAKTGWGGPSYQTIRAAAPFAILDTIYTGMQFIMNEDPAAVFPPLDVYWSVDNTFTEGTQTDVDIGELGGSFYVGDRHPRLFIMGDADVDTGEFDYYVTLHEWGHYVEDHFSRSDSIGGTHYIGGLVEARVAFGEGWGTGFGAMASGNPMACDTGAANGRGSWGFNVESYNGGRQGWYNEMSVATLLMDLYDTNDDGVDNRSIGFGPIFDVMRGPQQATEAFTSLFSFATLLRETLSFEDQLFLDALLAAENIETNGLDIWASTQANVDVYPNNARDVLPLYIDYAADGSTLTNICVNKDHDPDGDGNKPGEFRYLRITTANAAVYDVSIVTNPAPPPATDRSDPDIYFYLAGEQMASGFSGDADAENFATPLLPAGVYVADLHEWRFEDPDAAPDFPDQVCFDINMTPR